MILNATLNCGIGDIILSRNMFDGIRHRFDKIHISPNSGVLDTYRNGDAKFKSFAFMFMKLMFNHPKYIVELDKQYPKFSCIDNRFLGLDIPDNILYSVNDFSRYLCRGKDIDSDNYVVITTKVRGGPLQNDYHSLFKKPFLRALIELSKKHEIVILGEREIVPTYEYKLIGGQKIYCIYEDLVSYLAHTGRVIDKSISGDETNVSTIERLQHDCHIMRRAKNVITIGYGGNLILSLATSINSSNFLGITRTKGYDDSYYLRMSNYKQRKGVCITTNFDEFIEDLKK